ncbi:MAG TPA: hypothetical protein PLP31_14105 [Thermoanaerobaculaceae bacterium]|nr:hypothetical protein [Acidobacteriota bacterium]HPW56861.1 hypothetical protein [Thermoanaerobaculaceae bacterium]
MLRALVSLERLTWDEGAQGASYRCRPGHEPPGGVTDTCDAKELLTRVLMHITEPKVLGKILHHLDTKVAQERAPPPRCCAAEAV